MAEYSATQNTKKEPQTFDYLTTSLRLKITQYAQDKSYYFENTVQIDTYYFETPFE